MTAAKVSNSTLVRKLGEYNRLIAELSQIKRLTKSLSPSNSLITQLKFEKSLLELNYEKEIREEEYKQFESDLELNIKLPTKLQVCEIENQSLANCYRLEAETRAQVYRIKELGLANIESTRRIYLTGALGSKQVALALQQYYLALIIDKTAGYILNYIADKYRINPEFKFNLEKPIFNLVFFFDRRRRRRRKTNLYNSKNDNQLPLKALEQ